MRRRLAIAACLVFSGLTALVYQIIWVRLLGFTFGTTTAAVSTVLAVFFGGLALGNLLAALRLVRVRRPLRVYALLELAIGLYALASLPLLRSLDFLYALVGVEHGPAAMTVIRFAAASAVLLPPTVAMGATLPVVARGLVTDDATLGRWSAILYTANTLGAVAGAYLCGFWLIPSLGLTRTVLAAGATNLAVAAAVLAAAGRIVATGPVGAAAGPALGGAEARRRGSFLVFFAVSGFVAIGYEIVWSKVFGIVMEGTLYGFAAVLSAFLLGIALGSLAVAPAVDRIRDLPRAFGLLHAAIAVSVLVGMTIVPDLPYWFGRLSSLGGGDAIHVLYLLVLPIVLVPTALFGAAFPVLIRIYTGSAAAVGRGIGVATAVNTTGSIAASLLVGFWWIPAVGMDRSLEILLALDAGVALLVLIAFQRSRGWRRAAAWLASLAALVLAALPFEGVQVDRAIVGRAVSAATLSDYRRRLDAELASQIFRAEGKTSVVTVYAQPKARLLRTNGLPEAGYTYVPPYYPSESMYLGVLPYLGAGDPRRGLLIGLGGGNTLEALVHTELEVIDVVELESEVVEAIGPFTRGRENPLLDPRVNLVVNDGRNELLLALHDGRPRYDVIASQPSHPWRVGAANLFTEEYFHLARSMLSDSGRFALWVNGFRMDAESLLSIVASFERVFPGAIFVDVSHDVGRRAFLLLGGRGAVSIDVEVALRRMGEPGLRRLLERFGVGSVERLLAGIEGPASAFAPLATHPVNSDDDAYVETRIPRQMEWRSIDYASVESRLPPDAPVLPPLRGSIDLAQLVRALLELDGPWRFGPRIERLLASHGGDMDPVRRETLLATARLRDRARAEEAASALEALAAANPRRPEPLRALGEHRASRGDVAGAAEAFQAAYARSGAARDAFAAGRLRFSTGDVAAAFPWFERIPASQRADHPELAHYAAWRALEEGAGTPELRRAYEELLAYRDSDEGREAVGLEELLARLAEALGDDLAARGFSDLAAAKRRERGHAALRRAQGLLRSGRTDAAAAAVAEAERLIPADPSLATLRLGLALTREDPVAVRNAVGELRRWSPTRLGAILAENRVRQEAGLPLLPQLSLEALWSDASPVLLPGTADAAP
jgi:spermidine synthase